MRKFILILVFLIIGLAVSQTYAQDGLVTVQSNYSVEETADRLVNIFEKNGLTVFDKVDHQKGASSVNMEMRPTMVIIFGNPKLGTPLMKCAQTTAIDLPQKMLIWEAGDGKVKISYNSPEYLKKRHSIKGCNQELKKIAGALNKFALKAAGN